MPRDEIRGEENLARALEWLDAHKSGPAFLFLHFNDPHQPFVQPEPYDRKFGPPAESLGLTLPPNVPGVGEKERQQLFHDLYDGAVAYVDHCIGSFLDALRARGLYEGATIAFVADHGEQLWERGRFGHGGEATARRCTTSRATLASSATWRPSAPRTWRACAASR